MIKKLSVGKRMMLKMRGLMMKAMISCDHASRLASKAMDSKLTLGEKISLRMHLLACGFCREFEKQLISIRSILQTRSGEIPTDPAEPKLSQDARERLQKSIKDNK